MTTAEITQIDEFVKILKKQIIINRSRVSPPSSSENHVNNNEFVSLEDSIESSKNNDYTIQDQQASLTENIREAQDENLSSDEAKKEKVFVSHKRKPKKLKSSSESEGPNDDIPQLNSSLKRRRIIEPLNTSDEDEPCTSIESKRRQSRSSRRSNNSKNAKKFKQSSNSKEVSTIANIFAKKAGVSKPGKSSNEMPRELKFLYHDIHRDPDKYDVLTADKETRIRKKVDYRENERKIEETDTSSNESETFGEDIYSSESTSIKSGSSTTSESIPELSSEIDHAEKYENVINNSSNEDDDEEEDSELRQYCLEDFNTLLLVKKLPNIPKTVKIVDGKIVPLPQPALVDLTSSDHERIIPTTTATERSKNLSTNESLKRTPQNQKGYNLSTPSKSSLVQKAKQRISNLSFLKCGGGYQYHCNYDSCSMYYTSRESFKSHLSSSRHIDTKWDGFCTICNFKVSNKTSFIDEYLHMRYHIDGKQFKPTARKSTRKLSFNCVEEKNKDEISVSTSEMTSNNLESEPRNNVETAPNEDNILVEEINLTSIIDIKDDVIKSGTNLNLNVHSKNSTNKNQEKKGKFDENSVLEKEKLSVNLENSTNNAIVIPESLESVDDSTLYEPIDSPDNFNNADKDIEKKDENVHRNAIKIVDSFEEQEKTADSNVVNKTLNSLNDPKEESNSNDEKQDNVCETNLSNVEPDKSPKNSPPTVPVQPLIKLRRLSGDKLSTLNERVLEQTSHSSIPVTQSLTTENISKSSSKVVFSMARVSLPTLASTLTKQLNAAKKNTLNSDILVKVVEKPQSHTTTLSATNINPALNNQPIPSRRSSYSTPFQQKNVLQSNTSQASSNVVPTTLGISLQPWLNINSYKAKNLAYKMLNMCCLKSFYKCMLENCDYYTNDSVEFKNHLMKEEGTKKCCYCAFETDQVDTIISHIQQTHGTSSFGCNLCFFRGVNHFHLNTHILKYHKDLSYATILRVAPLQQFNFKKDILDGKVSRKQFVLPIICARK